MINDAIRLKDMGVNGIVIGLVDEKGAIPLNKLEKILNKVDGKTEFDLSQRRLITLNQSKILRL